MGAAVSVPRIRTKNIIRFSPLALDFAPFHARLLENICC